MKVQFQNPNGYNLTGRLELPVNHHPHSYAIFAHCFTCNKNLTAVKNISRMLNQSGIAVLRFDFTGLGESDGDFSDTNFTSNVEDLVSAASFLEQHYIAPNILIGHSLGGAAIIAASEKIESTKMLVTINSPFDPKHVQHLLAEDEETILKQGKACVQIGERKFTVKKQFLDDIQEQNLIKVLQKNRKALLIMHSPQDSVVEVENARKIYGHSFHPKSFISLDGADHLLSQKSDSQYVGEMIACWAKRYSSLPEKKKLNVDKEVAVRLGQSGFTTEVMVRQHQLTADEPESVGGNDFGPSPYELVTAGLGTCTAMTLQMYSRRKKWDLREVVVHLEHFKDYAADMADTNNTKSKIDHFDRHLELKGELTEIQKNRLLEIANKCPVHRTMEGEIKVRTFLKD